MQAQSIDTHKTGNDNSNEGHPPETALDAAARECDDLRRQAKEARAEAKKSGEEAAELRGQLAAAAKANPPAAATAKKPANPTDH